MRKIWSKSHGRYDVPANGDGRWLVGGGGGGNAFGVVLSPCFVFVILPFFFSHFEQLLLLLRFVQLLPLLLCVRFRFRFCCSSSKHS
ncbi:hypothetical protein B0I37DRAFT_364020 [Chaetomium sp. MPI-CAGE-AT-0009]|nr:hypothetical protein B0I37DRAFT_364020 [Chaetomium sp. MPI-CAGE-AT-0009]